MGKLVRATTLGTAIIMAILPLFCCWGSTLLAGVALLSGAAINMAWLHPYEPYLYGVSFISLGYGHYKAIKLGKNEAKSCQACVVGGNVAIAQKRTLSQITLWGTTVVVMLLFFYKLVP